MPKTRQLNQAVIDEFVMKSHHDFGKVQQLLLRYPDLVDAESTWGETAAEAASHTGQTDILEYLKSAGAIFEKPAACTGVCKATIHSLTDDLNIPPNAMSPPSQKSK
jgi:hypothetical protein